MTARDNSVEPEKRPRPSHEIEEGSRGIILPSNVVKPKDSKPGGLPPAPKK